MIRARLAQYVAPGVRYQDYIGPRDSIPAGWSIVTRRPVRRPLSSIAAASPSLSPDAGEVAVVGGLDQGDAA